MPSQDQLVQFAAWVKVHLTGDEKGETQIVLDHLFHAFGWTTGLEGAGATLEMRVPKADLGATAFADLDWKPLVLVEMKKRGTDLRKHYRQALDYWTRIAQLLAPNLAVAAKIERDEAVTPPGVPAGHPNPDSLVSVDCIKPTESNTT